MSEIECEVAYALAERQHVVKVRLPQGATALDALRASGLTQRFPGIEASGAVLGVFGKVVRADHVLAAGDRVEIYRPLSADPRLARRERARRK